MNKNFFLIRFLFFEDLVLKVWLLLILNILFVCFSLGVLIDRKKRAERTLVFSVELIDSQCCSDQFNFTHHYVSINIVPARPQINARLFFFFVFFSNVIFTPFDSSSLLELRRER